MSCTRPRTVGFQSDGKTISWSQKNYSKEYATFQLPCGKCLECRLDYGRQWAVRCVNEAQMHEKNSFITLTYDDAHLSSSKLVYSDFQNFMKKIRKTQNEPIGLFVTGEYGEREKRPHWHALLFNYRPSDELPFRKNERGDQIYTSATLGSLWGKGITEFGDVTFESAGYCARYAAKKLVHGSDEQHEYHPISKKSQRNAIGKKWIEKFWPDVFNYGEMIVDGVDVGIPRYYEKWLKHNLPHEWLRYVTEVKPKKMQFAQDRSDAEHARWVRDLNSRKEIDPFRNHPLTNNQKKEITQKIKFERLLQNFLKL